MRHLWARRDIDAACEVVWRLLVSPEQWPKWGPSVRSAAVDGGVLRAGARGTVTTALRFDVPFEITDFDDGGRWRWRVAGMPATDHTVEPLGPNRCRVAIGVPWFAAPYLAVCELAVRRLDELARTEQSAS